MIQSSDRESRDSMTRSFGLLGEIRDLVALQFLAVLSTEEQGQPYSNLIAFVSSEDLAFILFATTRSTRKYTNLLNEPRVSILIDNRRNEVIDFSEARAVTVLGKALELEGKEREQFENLYLSRHPHLLDFISSPTCALFKVEVERYILVSRFQEVKEFYPSRP
jgi:nitroimidazol reductase NimA-like FMN-containing flavoprotein (pyridoxamine 5'-phosphate oxidase superfamily)